MDFLKNQQKYINNIKLWVANLLRTRQVIKDLKLLRMEPGMVSHAFNPSFWEAEAEAGQPGLHSEFQNRTEQWFSAFLNALTL